MKRFLAFFAVALMTLPIGARAQGLPLFVQDDILLVYGPGGEGSAGSVVYGDGDLKQWSANAIFGSVQFKLTQASITGVSDGFGGNIWTTVYGGAVGDYMTLEDNLSNVLWTGDAQITTVIHEDAGHNVVPVAASLFVQPSYNSPPNPLLYQSYATGQLLGQTGGSWTSTDPIYVDWAGFYNFGDIPAGAGYRLGGTTIPTPYGAKFSNMQARLSIPEPAFFQMGALIGMSGLGLLRLRRRTA